MKLNIEIEMDNDAFGDGRYPRATEVNRILDDLTDYLVCYGIPEDGEGKLRDINGNTVGTWKVTK